MRTLSLIAAVMTFSSAAHAQSTNWRVQESVDPIDDSVTMMAHASVDRHSVLAVICRKDTLFVTVQTRFLDLEIGAVRPVVWRVDRDDAVRQNWQNGRKGGAHIFDEAAVDLARRIKTAEQRIVVASGGETRQFSVNGSTQAVSRVLAHCQME